MIAFLAAAALAVAPAPCAEDDACWTWSRMGDRRRGVVTLSGNQTVVGPCRFARMWERGQLRYSVTVDGRRFDGLLAPMRGDTWARQHGCDR